MSEAGSGEGRSRFVLSRVVLRVLRRTRLAQPLRLLVDDHVVWDLRSVALLMETLLAAVADHNHVGCLRLATSTHVAVEVVIGEAEVGFRLDCPFRFELRTSVVVVVFTPHRILHLHFLETKTTTNQTKC